MAAALSHFCTQHDSYCCTGLLAYDYVSQNAAKTFLKMLWSVSKGIFRVLQSVTGTRPAFGQETLDNCPAALRTGILPAQRD